MKKLFFLFTIVSSLILGSCSSDDNGNGGSSSRDVKYEITGNFSAPLDVTYITASGGATSTEVTSLPWSMSFTADAASTGASFNAGNAGGSGTPGQTISLKIYQGGVLKSTTDATANSDGIIVAVAPAIVF